MPWGTFPHSHVHVSVGACATKMQYKFFFFFFLRIRYNIINSELHGRIRLWIRSTEVNPFYQQVSNQPCTSFANSTKLGSVMFFGKRIDTQTISLKETTPSQGILLSQTLLFRMNFILSQTLMLSMYSLKLSAITSPFMAS